MGLHAYCVVPAASLPPDDLRGLEGARVRAVRAGDGLGVWASELAAAPETDVEALRIHDRVVRAAVSGNRIPLPVRFGSWFGSEDELVARVGERTAAYRESLDRVSGAREFAVRILEEGTEAAREVDGPAADAGSGPGTEYLVGLARRHAAGRRREERADRLLEALREAVAGLARDERVERPAPERGLLGVAHLVRTADADAYRASVEGFRRRHPGYRVVATGPWAPYSFAP